MRPANERRRYIVTPSVIAWRIQRMISDMHTIHLSSWCRVFHLRRSQISMIYLAFLFLIWMCFTVENYDLANRIKSNILRDRCNDFGVSGFLNPDQFYHILIRTLLYWYAPRTISFHIFLRSATNLTLSTHNPVYMAKQKSCMFAHICHIYIYTHIYKGRERCIIVEEQWGWEGSNRVHYSDVTWMSWRLKSLETLPFVE